MLTIYAGRTVYVISSQRLLNEVSDEKRFRKYIAAPVGEVRAATGDGLFTVSLSSLGMFVLNGYLLRLASRRKTTGTSRVSPSNIAAAKPYLCFILDRILMPAFSALNVHDMFDDMMDIISQLVLKWERSVELAR